MSRALIIINTMNDRAKAAHWAHKAPMGCRIEFKETKRSLPQNSLLWSLLSQVAAQKEHAGRRYTPDQWKILFMHACGREVQFVPSLDGSTFLPWSQSSSDLSKAEMTELIEFIMCWAAQNSVSFNEKEEAA